MLVDIPSHKPKPENLFLFQLTSLLSAVNGNDTSIKRLEKGVYEIGHHNFEHVLGFHNSYEYNYPSLRYVENNNDSCGSNTFSSYGVCDNWQQVVQTCANLSEDDTNCYVMSVTPVRRSQQEETGGWRWRKWGPYIGTQIPTTEYLYDEPEIELIYCFKIIQIPDGIFESTES